jgi:hypothetical protein
LSRRHVILHVWTIEVNIPLLYGEGGLKAFLRLQPEILSISDDESIFAWGLGDDYGNFSLYGFKEDEGLLALSPKRSNNSCHVKTYPEFERVVDRLPYAKIWVYNSTLPENLQISTTTQTRSTI